MLTTVDLDHKAPFDTGEVDNIGPEQHLPAEASAIQLLLSDAIPQPSLGIGRIAA
jgi:hypothetical protein